MKFETTARHLTSALRLSGQVIERRNSIPVLSTALFEGNRIRVTDLDIEIEIVVPTSNASGTAAIDHRALLNLVRHIPDDDKVKIEAGHQGATVFFSSGRYDIPSLPASDWPRLKLDETNEIDFNGSGFRKAIDFVSQFIPTEETRYYLNGVCLDDKVAIATDGHRLGCYPLGFDASPLNRMILPRKTVAILRRLSDPRGMGVTSSGQGARFTLDGVSLSTKVIDGTFPDWRRVIPMKPVSTLVVRQDALSRVMRRIASVLGGTHPYVTMAFDNQRLAISGRRSGEVTVREYVGGVSSTGKGQKIGFNAAYLGTLLRAFSGSERVDLHITDAHTPMLARAPGENDGPFAILMPARIADETLANETLAGWPETQDIGRAA